MNKLTEMRTRALAAVRSWTIRQWASGVAVALLLFAGAALGIGVYRAFAMPGPGVQLDNVTTVDLLSSTIVNGRKSVTDGIKALRAEFKSLGDKLSALTGRVDKIEQRPPLDMKELEKKIDEKTRKELQSSLGGLQKEAAERQPNFTRRPTA